MIRLARVHLFHLLVPPCQLYARHGRVRAFVHHIVHLSTECVKRRNGFSFLGGEEEKGVIKTRTGLYGLGLAIFVRTHAWYVNNWRRISVREHCAKKVTANLEILRWAVRGIRRSLIVPAVAGYEGHLVPPSVTQDLYDPAVFAREAVLEAGTDVLA